MHEIHDSSGTITTGDTIGFIDGNAIKAYGSGFTVGDTVVELSGDEITTPGGFLSSGEVIGHIHNNKLYSSDQYDRRDEELAYVDGMHVRVTTAPTQLFSHGDIIVSIPDDAVTARQRLAAAAAHLFEHI